MRGQKKKTGKPRNKSTKGDSSREDSIRKKKKNIYEGRGKTSSKKRSSESQNTREGEKPEAEKHKKNRGGKHASEKKKEGEKGGPLTQSIAFFEKKGGN